MTRAEVLELLRPLCDAVGVDPATVQRVVVEPRRVAVKHGDGRYWYWAGLDFTEPEPAPDPLFDVEGGEAVE
jgi:hypothetical protein